MERSREHLAGLGERPRRPVDVAVGRQHVEDPVELLAERQVLAAHASFEVGDLALDSVRLTSRSDLGPQVGVPRHGVQVGPFALPIAPRRFELSRGVELDLAQSTRDVVAVVLRFGAQGVGSTSVADADRRLVEVLGHRRGGSWPTW